MNGRLIQSFSDLTSDLLAQNERTRVVFVALKVRDLPDDVAARAGKDPAGSGLKEVNVVVVFQTRLATNLSFKGVTKFLQSQNKDWDMIIVSWIRNPDGSMPTDEQGMIQIKNMRKAIASGHAGKYMSFDTRGFPCMPIAKVDIGMTESESDQDCPTG